VAAGNLLPWKARLLLALGLTRTRDPEEIQGLFDRY
jgi:L-asparaginase